MMTKHDAAPLNITAANPDGLAAREDLDTAEKVRLLREWERDLRELMVADDENMGADQALGEQLREVLIALERLGAAPHSSAAPTTHG